MTLAFKAIDSFRPPADSFDMRMSYSLYIVHFMSVIDLGAEKFANNFYSELENSLNTSTFSGCNILSYVRELRNGVVHRGTNPTAGGVVIDEHVLAVSPPTVKNRNGSRQFSAPSQLLREIFIHCEICTKPILERFLDLHLNAIEATTPETMMKSYLAALDDVQHMPDWAKDLARSHTTPEMLTMAGSHERERLRAMLKPPAGQRIP